jgi:hypothetical protein
MPLPKAATKPKTNFNEYTTLIYGAPKAGKSTLASQFDSPLFIATEAGLNALETYNVAVDNWETFIVTCAEIAKGDHQFKTIVIDTIDNLFKHCSSYICKKQNIQHESELDWGKGWKLVKDEFFRAIIKLSLLKYGLVLVSHAEATEIKTRTGTITKWVPTMSKQAKEVILPMCDFIFFATIEQTPEGIKRMLKTKPSENWEGGDRTGTFPAEIEMNYKAIEENFKKSINGGKKL